MRQACGRHGHWPMRKSRRLDTPGFGWSGVWSAEEKEVGEILVRYKTEDGETFRNEKKAVLPSVTSMSSRLPGRRMCMNRPEAFPFGLARGVVETYPKYSK